MVSCGNWISWGNRFSCDNARGRRRRTLLAKTVLTLLLVCASSLASAGPADDQYDVATGHYSRKLWKLAVDEFEVFLEKYPDDPRAADCIFALAEALLQAGDTEQAESRFREYLKQAPKGKYAGRALFRAGEAAYLLGKAKEAQADLTRFLAEHATDKFSTYAIRYLGELAMERKEFNAAAELFRDGLRRYPDGSQVDHYRYGLARSLKELQQLDEAEKLYAEVAAKNGSPLADAARLNLGVLQFSRDRYEAALETLAPFEKELAASSLRPDAQLTRGWALLELDRPKEASPVFGSVVGNASVAVEARYGLGLAEYENEQWQRAAQTLDAAAEIDPKHALVPAIRYYAGDALMKAGDAKGAASRFDQVLAIGGESNAWLDDAACGKISLALRAGDREAVEKEADRFHKAFPDSPLRRQVNRMLARALVEQRKFTEAIALLQPMITAQPDGPDALENRYLLAASLDGSQRYEEALAALTPVLEKGEGRLKSDAQLVAGSSLLSLKRYSEAIGPLEAFLASQPQGDTAIRAEGLLAVAFARTGKLAESKSIFDRLVESHTDHNLLPAVVEQLGEAAYTHGDIKWSLALFEWLSRHGDSPENRQKGLAGAAWSSYKLEKLPEAAALFAELLETDPPAAMAAEACLARGRILEEQGQLDGALGLYSQVIEKYAEADVKEYPPALLAAARLHRRLEQHRQAAGLYERLAHAFPESPDRDAVLYEWSWVLFDQGNPEESNALLARLRSEYPQSRYWADATYRLAIREFQAKGYAEAAKLCQEIVDSKTQGDLREHSLYLLARIAAVEAEQNGKWELVQQQFQRLLEGFPDTSMRLVAEFWIAESLYRRQKYTESLAEFDRLAQRTQGQTSDWMAMIPLRRAQLLAHQRKWNEAFAIASKIPEQFPSFQQQYEADYVIGRCLAALADFDGAREAYERVINSEQGAKTETAAMAQWMIGETYFHQKRYDVAMREYLRVARLYAYPKWQAGSLLQGAKCRELLGEPEEAARLYEEVLEEYADTPFAEQAKQRLEAARSPQGESPATQGSEN